MFIPLGVASGMETESELAVGLDVGFGLGVGVGVSDDTGAGEGEGEGEGEGMAGDVMLSRASGICAASGLGVEGSIGSRYGSASP